MLAPCTIRTATKPSQPIEKSNAGAGLLTQVLPGSVTTSDVDAVHFRPAEDVEEPLFTVTLGGKPVAFTGPHYKRPAPVASMSRSTDPTS